MRYIEISFFQLILSMNDQNFFFKTGSSIKYPIFIPHKKEKDLVNSYSSY